MRKLTLSLAALLFLGGSAFADSYRVHYSIRGSGAASKCELISSNSKPFSIRNNWRRFEVPGHRWGMGSSQ